MENKKVILLLHGYPQTSYAWRFVTPLLAKEGYKVIAPDLPGLGDTANPVSFDKKTIAVLIHDMMKADGYNDIYLVGHDWGASVAYSYAAQFGEEVKRLVLMDVPPVGEYLKKTPLLPPNNKGLWWFAFHQVHQLPELLVAGKEREYLQWFYHNSSFKKEVFDNDTINEYYRTYSQADKMSNGFNYYRTILQDINDNKAFGQNLLQMPVLAIGGEHGLGQLAYNITKPLVADITGAVIPDCGHYIQEEQPDFLVKELIQFFSK
ncbi:alpha/beta fold hydrolase [Chitinophaga pinensis]|uniref:Alpha/beta hydrolase fold protein n=1 Tax=Chitinophaga pinensis (strain ATCC 43595 / DSM 2588 / LMG 13176 / NBRC 15968 / NCIMB 11800 / UQM 2034) TaxID=485918 RepID=A0A979G6K2_CHIPD|nr:alpha/beta hydrolase [Chitinophaga pinensis]ACU61737.1 alpha/beta hydrolase fold protein [Chitinophaga pinensis DSM 2588]